MTGKFYDIRTRKPPKLTPEIVQWIRDAFLLDRYTISKIRDILAENDISMSRTMIFYVARGVKYADVDNSDRLEAALSAAGPKYHI